MLQKVDNKWKLVTETYNDSSTSNFSILERLPRFLMRGSYVHAANELQDVVNKKRKSGERNPDIVHHAFEIAKRYRGVDHRKLVTMVECIEMIYQLFGNNILLEITNVPGYNPVGLAEFFRLMSDKTVPQEDKNEVKRLSALHMKEPTAGHDKKVAEIFHRHGISLKGVVKHDIGESINIKKDILPRSGAGQDGTDELRRNYTKATPGQKIKKT